MEIDENGKVDDKIPIFSDILAFLWAKMKSCTRDNLVDVIEKAFKVEEITAARELIHRKLSPPKRLVRPRNKTEITRALYDELQEMPTDAPYLFVAKDITRLPCLDMKNIDSVNLLCEQNTLKIQMEHVLNEQTAMKAQLCEITQLLHRSTDKMEQTSAINSYAQMLIQPKVTDSTTSHNPVAAALGSNLNGDPVGGPTAATGAVSRAPRPAPAIPVARAASHVTYMPAAAAPHREEPAAPPTHEPPQLAPRGYASDGDGYYVKVPRDRRNVQQSEQQRRYQPQSHNPSQPQFHPQSQPQFHPQSQPQSQPHPQPQHPKHRNIPVVTGKKKGSKLKSIPRRVNIFVSRLDPDETEQSIVEYVQEITGQVCIVRKLNTRAVTFSSFVIACKEDIVEKIMDPEEWEEGVIIRPFIGYFPSIKPPQHGVQNSTDPTAANRTDSEIPEAVEPIENKDNQEVNDLIQLTQSGSRTDIQE